MDRTDAIRPGESPGPQATTTQPGRASPQARRRFESLLHDERAADGGSDDDGRTGTGAENPTPPSPPPAPWFHAGAAPASFLLGPAAPEGGDGGTPKDLPTLLESVCSSLHLAQERGNRGHVLIGLDTVLPGTSVELIGDGPRLRVRLHTSDPATRVLLLEEKDSLLEALRAASALDVMLEVVSGESDRP